MTLNQLKVFVLVVRLGSFKAAADALGVSEPAVSQAIAALRQSLGDPLVTKAGGAVELTAAGRRVIGLASQMVNLAVEAEDAVRQSQGGPALLRVVAAATPADLAVPALLQAYTDRSGEVEATLGVATTEEMEALLIERLADVAIGPALTADGIVSAPLLRYRLGIATAADHPLARHAVGRVVAARTLATANWFVDPSGTDPTSPVGSLVRRLGVEDRRVSVFPSMRAAWAAAASGDGVAPAVEHVFAKDRPSGLAMLPVEGTPIDLMWHANTAGGRRSAVVDRFSRFLSAPDAMQAMVRGDGRVPAKRFKPPVYVTIWS